MPRFLLFAFAILGLVVAGLCALSIFSQREPELGLIRGSFRPCPASPNCVSSKAEDESHRIEAISVDVPLEQVIPELKRVLEGMERIEVMEATANYLHAEAKSAFFRFVDDMEFFVDPKDKYPVLHVRSASRVGYSDMGANRRRVEEVRQAFYTRVRLPSND